jgi:hypothetical protein
VHVVRQGDARERGPPRGWAAAVAVKEALRDSRKGAVGAAAGVLRVCLGNGFGYQWGEVRGFGRDFVRLMAAVMVGREYG